MKTKEEGKVATRYAKALFESLEQNQLDEMANDLSDFANIWQESIELRNALLNPAIALEDRIAVCRELLASSVHSELLGNFAAVLLENSRTTALPQIAQAFNKILANFKKSLALEITSAFPIEAQEQDEILAKIKSTCGALVSIEWQVDEALIGGLLIKAGDTVLDNSVRTSLAKIENTLSGN